MTLTESSVISALEMKVFMVAMWSLTGVPFLICQVESLSMAPPLVSTGENDFLNAASNDTQVPK